MPIDLLPSLDGSGAASRVWTPQRPAIVRPGEPWEHRVGAQLAKAGVRTDARRAILAELRRLQDADGLIARPAPGSSPGGCLADLSRWSGVKLAMLPGMIPVLTRPAPRVTFVAATSDTANATTYTFTSASIGTASADRLVVVVATGHSASNRTFSSGTIGGNAATVVLSSASAQPIAGIMALLVTSGTTATIAITFSAGISRAAIHVYTITGLGSLTAYHSAGNTTGSGTSLSATPNIPGGGVLIAGAANGGSGSAFSWAGASVDSNVAPETALMSAASASNLPAETGRTVTASFTGGADAIAIAAASWR
jgi:hypothetical protein